MTAKSFNQEKRCKSQDQRLHAFQRVELSLNARKKIWMTSRDLSELEVHESGSGKSAKDGFHLRDVYEGEVKMRQMGEWRQKACEEADISA